jgi:hypothetical protein
MRPVFFNRQGEPIDQGEYLRLRALPFESYARVAFTECDDASVSTVWLGIDHSFWDDDGPPLIFETLVSGGHLDGRIWRWPNDVAALAGHDQVCADVRHAVRRPTD